MAVAIFRNRDAAHFRHHFVAVLADIDDFKTELIAVKRADKIGNLKVAFRAADIDPLLAEIDERTIQARGNAAVKKKLGGKIGRHGRIRLREHPRRNFARQPPVQRPQREPDVIPAEIAEAAGGFERGVHADVFAEKFLVAGKTELRDDALDLADAGAVIERLADARE